VKKELRSCSACGNVDGEVVRREAFEEDLCEVLDQRVYRRRRDGAVFGDIGVSRWGSEEGRVCDSHVGKSVNCGHFHELCAYTEAAEEEGDVACCEILLRVLVKREVYLFGGFSTGTYLAEQHTQAQSDQPAFSDDGCGVPHSGYDQSVQHRLQRLAGVDIALQILQHALHDM